MLLGVGDDAALLEVPPGRVLVAATDTLVEGRHFLPDAPPDSVGHQALAVNLSDLAAMGAEPAWALLSLSLPEADDDVARAVCRGPLRARRATRRGTGGRRHGARPARRHGHRARLRRARARAATQRRAAGRPAVRLRLAGRGGGRTRGAAAGRGARADDPLVRRCRYAEPRLELGSALRGRASAAMDVSDGLLGDLGKLCAASGVGAVLDLERLPVSAELARRHAAADCERLVLVRRRRLRAAVHAARGRRGGGGGDARRRRCRCTASAGSSRGRGVQLPARRPAGVGRGRRV